ncbi:MAG TPA: serine/threonine-protein kinase [Myxococcaceae bacterium]|nr:serine/threonine-protein kinase [Myxococcaceae bacterium]
MTTSARHPDQLRPGDSIGPWRIVASLGSGGFGRVFCVERGGRLHAAKMALRPVSEPSPPEEEDINRRLGHEAAVLLALDSHPNLPRLHAVERWPDEKGYLYLVIDLVEGDTFHVWRRKACPTAAELVEVFSEVVRAVGELHRRGVYHRDIKAPNILVQEKDRKPYLVDFGVARLPGAATLTLGVAAGTLYMLPPEALAFVLAEEWKEGARFEGGAAADLYALGVLLYEALTDLHPFDPGMEDELLFAAIARVAPSAPHLLNPRVPKVLSDIALRLLEKKPEARYPSAEALLQALEEAAKERESAEWKVPLCEPEEAVAEEAAMKAEAQGEEAREEQQVPSPPEGKDQSGEQPEPKRGGSVRRWWKARWPWLLGTLACVLLLGLASWWAGSTLASSSEAASGASSSFEKGTSPMPESHSPSDASSVREAPRSGLARLITTVLCSTVGLGCPAAQVRPLKSEKCPAEARRAMFEEFGLTDQDATYIILDIHQPGTISMEGVYRNGPIISRVATFGNKPPPGRLPEGTLLYGRFHAGPGVKHRDGHEAVTARYDRALLPDGREYPVCFSLGGQLGRLSPWPGSKPGVAIMPRMAWVTALPYFP